MRATEDPTVVIIEEEPGRVVYRTINIEPEETWEITGTCNMCGQCEVGGVNGHIQFTGIPIGEPGAAVDIRGANRPDNPVRPEMTEKLDKCVLSGRYL